MAVSGLLAMTIPPLVFHGAKAMAFLPKAMAVNHAATEIMYQMTEGSFSTLAGQPMVQGLRFALRRSSSAPALWLAADDCVGFRASGGQDVLIWWDSSTETMRRRVSPAACPMACPAPSAGSEALPYEALGSVRVLQIPAATSVFRYYNQSGVAVGAPGCSLGGITSIRRIDVGFVAQSGSGQFDSAQAQQTMTSSVAIRVP